MSARLLEHNDLHLLSGQGKLGFLGIGDKAEAERKAANVAEAQAKYPFPPKGCGDAIIKISMLQNDIEAQQKVLVTDGGNRVAKRWIEAFTGVQNDFKNWTTARKCAEEATQAEDTAFYSQINQAIDKQTQGTKSKASVDNWIIYGVLGVLGVGALIIILRK